MIRLAAQRASRSSPSEHDSFRLSPGCRGGFVGPIARSETTDLLARTARADHPPSSESTGHRFDATTISAESTDHSIHALAGCGCACSRSGWWRRRSARDLADGECSADVCRGSERPTGDVDRVAPTAIATGEPPVRNRRMARLLGSTRTTVARSDVSADAGLHWTRFDGGEFNSVACAHDGPCFAVGEGGRVAKLRL
jgi:hypothetical protein